MGKTSIQKMVEELENRMDILVGVKREGWFILSGLKRRMGYPGRIEEKDGISW